MSWFRLDDTFHTHPKVLAAGNEAVGLYVRCGTYAAQHLTDGFIPESVALLYGSDALAETLVRTKLWRRVRGGWRMPDYLQYNPSKQEAVEKSKVRAEAGRLGGVASGKSRSKPEANASRSVEPRPGPIPVDPVVDVVNRTNGSSRARDLAVIDAIIKEIHDKTGTLIDPDWASRIAAELVTPGVANPAAYVRQAIRNEPNPSARFLPHAVYSRHAKTLNPEPWDAFRKDQP